MRNPPLNAELSTANTTSPSRTEHVATQSTLQNVAVASAVNPTHIQNNFLQNNLRQEFGSRLIEPVALDRIPTGQYLVYALERNGQVIVLGHGQRSRARVVLDDLTHTTKNHIKALFVRLYHVYGSESDVYQRFVIRCADKAEAAAVERQLHSRLGGNNRDIPDAIRSSLFAGLTPHSVPLTLLHAALLSSYDGLNDLRNLHQHGIISNSDWAVITRKLRLDHIA